MISAAIPITTMNSVIVHRLTVDTHRQTAFMLLISDAGTQSMVALILSIAFVVGFREVK